MAENKAVSRRRKRKYKCLDPEVAKLRRLTANFRERERMNMLNTALDKLRCALPAQLQNESKLSKIDTLKLAGDYIKNLSHLLETSDKLADNNSTSYSSEKDVIFPEVTAPIDENEIEFPSFDKNSSIGCSSWPMTCTDIYYSIPSVTYNFNGRSKTENYLSTLRDK